MESAIPNRRSDAEVMELARSVAEVIERQGGFCTAISGWTEHEQRSAQDCVMFVASPLIAALAFEGVRGLPVEMRDARTGEVRMILFATSAEHRGAALTNLGGPAFAQRTLADLARNGAPGPTGNEVIALVDGRVVGLRIYPEAT
mgnify:CR=1 FL=1